jgi:hypothetical protein
MPDINLVEGSLSFTFENVDFAEKYDDWQHYRSQYNQTCGGSKAVDFIVSKNAEVWLIEVKDFRQHRRTKALDLGDEIAIKVRDTMAGLVSAKYLANDNVEATASRAALSGAKLRVAFHLEQPRNTSRLFPVSVNPAAIKMKLKQVLRFADHHPQVFDRRNFPVRLGAVVSI